MRSSDAKTNDAFQRGFLAAIGEDRQRVLSHRAVGARALKRGFDAVVTLHQRNGLFEVAITNVTFGNRSVPEFALT